MVMRALGVGVALLVAAYLVFVGWALHDGVAARQPKVIRIPAASISPEPTCWAMTHRYVDENVYVERTEVCK